MTIDLRRLSLSFFSILALGALWMAVPARAEDPPAPNNGKGPITAVDQGQHPMTKVDPAQADKPLEGVKTEKELKAEAKEKAAQKMSPEDEKRMAAIKEFAEKVNAQIKDIAMNLTGENQKHFYMLYSNHNLISATQTVMKDVENAVKACGTTNADMKPELDKKYSEWRGALAPVMKEANGNLDNMISAQDYAPPSTIRKLFDALDELREKTMMSVDKTPVTSPEACKYLEDKMGDTQDHLTLALRSTLVSYARALPNDLVAPAPKPDAPPPMPAEPAAKKTP